MPGLAAWAAVAGRREGRRQGTAKGPVLLLTACVVLTTASVARGQADSQLWANVTMDLVHGDRTTFTVDVEPKVLLDAPTDTPGWWNVDLTSGVEQTLTPWLDGSAEVATGYTRQTDDLNSVELTPRAGVRLHLFSRGLPILRSPDRPPRRRLVIRDLVRVEGRTLFYTGAGSGSSSQLRFRNRVEFVLPLNRSRTTEPGAWNLLADWESFIPLGDPAERFSNRQRIRVGVGTRRDGWSWEVLGLWTRSRNTLQEGFETTEYCLDIRVKRTVRTGTTR